jgi:uncharacterized protein YndB with AHSA1/START domain
VSVEALSAIRKSVLVSASPETAWRLFVERIAEWWPVESHSLGGDKVEAAVVTPERIYERWHDGTERVWGRMLAWEPPSRLVFTWEVSRNCGNEVEVRFLPEGEGTRVELEHRGWEHDQLETWGSYEGGWDFVLGRYEGAAG